MWQKHLIEKMFPDNVIPGSGMTASDLEYSNFDIVNTTEKKMARNMLGETMEITWFPDGTVSRVCTYDVYPFAPVNGRHVLSFYGGKMVQNWLQLEEYQGDKELKEIENAGFNYTGL